MQKCNVQNILCFETKSILKIIQFFNINKLGIFKGGLFSKWLEYYLSAIRVIIAREQIRTEIWDFKGKVRNRGDFLATFFHPYTFFSDFFNTFYILYFLYFVLLSFITLRSLFFTLFLQTNRLGLSKWRHESRHSQNS